MKQPGLHVAYLSMQNQKKPFDDPRVRRPSRSRIDKNRSIQAGWQGQAQPAVTPVPPALPGHANDLADHARDIARGARAARRGARPQTLSVRSWPRARSTCSGAPVWQPASRCTRSTVAARGPDSEQCNSGGQRVAPRQGSPMPVDRLMPTEEADELIALVREIAAEQLAPRAAEAEASGEFPRDVFHLLGETGLLSLPFDEADGGGGQPYEVYLQVLEEIATAWMTVAVDLSVHTLSTSALARFGSDEQRERWLPGHARRQPARRLRAVRTAGGLGRLGYRVQGGPRWRRLARDGYEGVDQPWPARRLLAVVRPYVA